VNRQEPTREVVLETLKVTLPRHCSPSGPANFNHLGEFFTPAETESDLISK
jgi:hypothetical protein